MKSCFFILFFQLLWSTTFAKSDYFLVKRNSTGSVFAILQPDSSGKPPSVLEKQKYMVIVEDKQVCGEFVRTPTKGEPSESSMGEACKPNYETEWKFNGGKIESKEWLGLAVLGCEGFMKKTTASKNTIDNVFSKLVGDVANYNIRTYNSYQTGNIEALEFIGVALKTKKDKDEIDRPVGIPSRKFGLYDRATLKPLLIDVRTNCCDGAAYTCTSAHIVLRDCQEKPSN